MPRLWAGRRQNQPVTLFVYSCWRDSVAIRHDVKRENDVLAVPKLRQANLMSNNMKMGDDMLN